jgi:hypothetical protein
LRSVVSCRLRPQRIDSSAARKQKLPGNCQISLRGRELQRRAELRPGPEGRRSEAASHDLRRVVHPRGRRRVAVPHQRRERGRTRGGCARSGRDVDGGGRSATGLVERDQSRPAMLMSTIRPSGQDRKAPLLLRVRGLEPLELCKRHRSGIPKARPSPPRRRTLNA